MKPIILGILVFLFIWVMFPGFVLWAIIYGIKGGLIDKKIYNYRSKRFEIGRDAVIYGSLQIVAGIGGVVLFLFIIIKGHLITRGLSAFGL